jgi:hypothetical protein
MDRVERRNKFLLKSSPAVGVYVPSVVMMETVAVIAVFNRTMVLDELRRRHDTPVTGAKKLKV